MQNILKSIFCNLFQPNLQEKGMLSGSWRETVEMRFLLYWEFPAVLSAQKYVHPTTPTFETVLSGKYPSLHNISAEETLFSVLSKSMLFLFSLCCLGEWATRCHCFSCWCWTATNVSCAHKGWEISVLITLSAPPQLWIEACATKDGLEFVIKHCLNWVLTLGLP